jgi:predicted nucleic acid-binding protein
MEVTWVSSIPDGATVLVDTNPVIYVLAGHRLGAQFEELFADIANGRISALTTPITLAEVVAGPLSAGNESLAARYQAALTSGPGWRLREIDAEIAVLASRLRIQHRLRLPDALQLATAVYENCFAVITHDRDFRRVREMRVLGLA